jgi:hypothetical protein
MRSYNRYRFHLATLVCGAAIAVLMTGCASKGFDAHRSPGAWKQSVTFIKLGEEDLLPEAAKSAVGIPMVSEPYCLTSQSVSADTLESRLTNIAVLDPEWKMGAITVIDGAVSSSATGPLGKITYSGKLSPKMSDITMTMTMTAGSSAQGQTTTIQRMSAEHIGPCTPDMVTMGQ